MHNKTNKDWKNEGKQCVGSELVCSEQGNGISHAIVYNIVCHIVCHIVYYIVHKMAYDIVYDMKIDTCGFFVSETMAVDVEVITPSLGSSVEQVALPIDATKST